MSLLARLGLSSPGGGSKARPPSQLLMVSLSALMLFFAAQPLLLHYGPPVDLNEVLKDAPALTTFRQPEDGKTFFDNRMQRAPGLYGGLHVVPAIIWSLGIPLQHSARLRSSYRALHRWVGRATLWSAVVLNISGLLFIPLDLSYSIETLALHRWGTLVWPSFNLAAVLIGVAWPATTLMAWQTARAKKFEQHRRWATVHTATGYVITLQRIGMLLVGLVGALAAQSPALAKALQIPHYSVGTEAFEKERAAFALGTWLMIPWTGVWLLHLFPAPQREEKKEA